ncbi:dynein regulatory complex subunit 3-like [Aduncisulcus paluster]|uniref:Dynein regulatory complex subunit 3-like n=1 Tax=Aduncisulcus paluster TaxID=2918883 RepID=A0ABQ5KIV2_9EUKA|nr:dynein regulatory complex subunit 3-like [Aduncisulcus paluster]
MPQLTPKISIIDQKVIKESLEKDDIRVEPYNYFKIEKIRFSFCNLVEISNLTDFVSLRSLHLDNNKIESIKGLEMCVNLEFLDLSFNKIKAIENLFHLKKLKDLSLAYNQIKHLSGLSDLKSLQILSLSNNSIEEAEQFTSLRSLKQLRVLTVHHNPVCKSTDFNTYVIAHLSFLKKLDYRIVTEEKKKRAYDQYRDELMEAAEKEREDDKEEGVVGADVTDESGTAITSTATSSVGMSGASSSIPLPPPSPLLSLTDITNLFSLTLFSDSDTIKSQSLHDVSNLIDEYSGIMNANAASFRDNLQILCEKMRVFVGQCDLDRKKKIQESEKFCVLLLDRFFENRREEHRCSVAPRISPSEGAQVSELWEEVECEIMEEEEAMEYLDKICIAKNPVFRHPFDAPLSTAKAFLPPTPLVASIEALKVGGKAAPDPPALSSDSPSNYTVLCDALMEEEANLSHTLAGISKTFDDLMVETYNQCIEVTQTFFQNAREQETSLHDKSVSVGLEILDKVQSDPGAADSLTSDARAIVKDKSTVTGLLTSTHDLRLGKLEMLEEQLQTRFKDYYEGTKEALNSLERYRSRTRLLELARLRDRMERGRILGFSWYEMF